MKQTSTAVARNRDPILAVLREVLPPEGLVLEIASGTGEHALHFATHLPGLRWQPTDPSDDALTSIAAWREEGPENLLAPVQLDVLAPWPITQADAVFCANMIHIAPWACTLALLDGAARTLTDGPLVLYGPYRRAGAHTAPSNAAFDDWLKGRDPSYGVRDLEEVEAEAAARGLTLRRLVDMPANNFLLVFSHAAR